MQQTLWKPQICPNLFLCKPRCTFYELKISAKFYNVSITVTMENFSRLLQNKNIYQNRFNMKKYSCSCGLPINMDTLFHRLLVCIRAVQTLLRYKVFGTDLDHYLSNIQNHITPPKNGVKLNLSKKNRKSFRFVLYRLQKNLVQTSENKGARYLDDRN